MESTQFAQPPPSLTTLPPSMNIPPPNLTSVTPTIPNLSMPPPNLISPGISIAPSSNFVKFDNRGSFNNRNFFRPFQSFGPRGPLGPMTLEDFDGKRLRKSVMRKTVDYNSAIIKALENRVWQRDFRDRRALQPDVMYYPDLTPPPSYLDNAINCVTTRFVKTATNKMRCPIFCMAWTPEGRRLVTGASSGEFTLWNGLTFNFETILQAHDSPVRTMVWSHNDSWMVTGDHAGYVKYWQSNMNNVKMFQAHKEALRGISFSPSDTKFVTCSDDGTLRIWDFYRCQEERVLRGHGADVKCVHWHPQKGLIISGSKDNQQPIKLWDPKSGQSLATLHAHKSTVMDLKWNENGNWLITASRDHLLKLFDLRNLNQEVQTFRGHKKEASSVAWHPIHEGLFSSGGSDGAIMFWHVGADKEVGAIEQAHDSIVWTLAWHPLGHILCSGSNDHTSKFWTRNRPGDLMRDKYNLNTLPAGLSGLDDADIDEPSVIPGMGPEDKVDLTTETDIAAIPGLDLDITSALADDKASKLKKVPYSKPIPRNFQAQWNETSAVEEEDPASAISEVISHIVENTPGVVPLEKIEPSAIIVYGKLVPVESGSRLEKVIGEGPDALKKFIASGEIEELQDVIPHEEDDDYLNDAYIDDDIVPSAACAIDVELPPPLPSSKMAQFQKSKSKDDDPKEGRVRRSRFSDADDTSNSDQDLRVIFNQQPRMDVDLRPTFQENERRSLEDMDYRNHDDDFEKTEHNDLDYRTTFYNNDKFNDNDFRNRFESPDKFDDQHWMQNNGQHFGSGGDNFNHDSSGGSNYNRNNGPFISNSSQQFNHNFQQDFRGGSFNNNFMQDQPNQYRSESNWNGNQRNDQFRNRGGFPSRMSMRGPRARGFPPGGPRGGPWLPPRGNAPNNNMRGRSGF